MLQNFSEPEDLSAYDGLELRLKGDGRRYKLIVRTSSDWDTVGYTAIFDTVEGWQSVSFLWISAICLFSSNLNFILSASFPGPFALFFFEAYIPCTNRTRCITFWPQSNHIITGILCQQLTFVHLCTLFPSFLHFYLFFPVNLQLMFSKFESDGKLNPTFKEGPFELPVSCIRAYLKDPITPRFESRSHFYIVSLNLKQWVFLPYFFFFFLVCI